MIFSNLVCICENLRVSQPVLCDNYVILVIMCLFSEENGVIRILGTSPFRLILRHVHTDTFFFCGIGSPSNPIQQLTNWFHWNWKKNRSKSVSIFGWNMRWNWSVRGSAIFSWMFSTVLHCAFSYRCVFHYLLKILVGFNSILNYWLKPEISGIKIDSVYRRYIFQVQ